MIFILLVFEGLRTKPNTPPILDPMITWLSSTCAPRIDSISERRRTMKIDGDILKQKMNNLQRKNPIRIGRYTDIRLEMNRKRKICSSGLQMEERKQKKHRFFFFALFYPLIPPITLIFRHAIVIYKHLLSIAVQIIGFYDHMRKLMYLSNVLYVLSTAIGYIIFRAIISKTVFKCH